MLTGGRHRPSPLLLEGNDYLDKHRREVSVALAGWSWRKLTVGSFRLSNFVYPPSTKSISCRGDKGLLQSRARRLSVIQPGQRKQEKDDLWRGGWQSRLHSIYLSRARFLSIVLFTLLSPFWEKVGEKRKEKVLLSGWNLVLCYIFSIFEKKLDRK